MRSKIAKKIYAARKKLWLLKNLKGMDGSTAVR